MPLSPLLIFKARINMAIANITYPKSPTSPKEGIFPLISAMPLPVRNNLKKSTIPIPMNVITKIGLDPIANRASEFNTVRTYPASNGPHDPIIMPAKAMSFGRLIITGKNQKNKVMAKVIRINARIGLDLKKVFMLVGCWMIE